MANQPKQSLEHYENRLISFYQVLSNWEEAFKLQHKHQTNKSWLCNQYGGAWRLQLDWSSFISATYGQTYILSIQNFVFRQFNKHNANPRKNHFLGAKKISIPLENNSNRPL